MPDFVLTPIFQVSLSGAQDCALIGVMPNGDSYIEALQAGDWVLQFIFDADGHLLKSVDEHRRDAWLTLPDELVGPRVHEEVRALSFVGPRERGLRGDENLLETLQPLTVAEKMALIQRLGLTLSPMSLLGISESRILSSVPLQEDAYLVCRRVRLAFVVNPPQRDRDGLLYDYDTLSLYVLHPYAVDTDAYSPLHEVWGMFADKPMFRPQDCVLVAGRLYVADGGTTEHPPMIHVWQLEIT